MLDPAHGADEDWGRARVGRDGLMRFRRRDRNERPEEPDPQVEERFFAESAPELEINASPELGPEPELEKDHDPEPGPPATAAAAQSETDTSEPPTLSADVMEAESADSPVDFILEPPTHESALEEESPSSTPVDSPTEAIYQNETQAEPPRIPPLPTDPARNPQADEPDLETAAPAVAAPVAVPEPEHEPEPEPEHEAAPVAVRAETAPQDNFAQRAQMAMSRLGDLPTSNGVHKTRSLPRVVAIANQKGGVGKTTTTVNLGAALSELDYRVLVVDLDPQGNATSGLGIDTRNFESSMYDVIMRDAPIEDCIEPTSVQNLFVTPATIDLAGVEIELVSAFSRELKLKRAIDTVVDDFDFVLIDCPPSLGLLTINGLAAASEVLVPIQCEYYALEGLSQLIRNVQLVASNLNKGLEISAIVLTMFDARTRLAIDVANEVRSHFKEVVCRSIIPRTVRLSEAPSFGQPITVFDPSSRGAVAYRELAKEVSDGAPKRSG